MENNHKEGKAESSRNMAALDLCFILVIATLMTGAFISALT